jgi:WD40 repeat protein
MYKSYKIIIVLLLLIYSDFIILNSQQLEVVVSSGPGWVRRLDFNKSGTLLASCETFGESIHIWDVKSGAEVNTIKCKDRVDKMQFLNSDNLLGTFLKNGDFIIWDVKKGQVINKLDSIDEDYSISNDGKYLFSLVNYNIEFENFSDKVTEENIDSMLVLFEDMQFNNDSFYIKLFELPNGNRVRIFSKSGNANSIVSNSNSEKIAFFYQKSKIDPPNIVIMNTKNWQELNSINLPYDWSTLHDSINGDGIPSLAFSSNNEFLVYSTDKDSLIHIYDFSFKKWISNLKGHVMDAYDFQKERDEKVQRQCGTHFLEFMNRSNYLVSSGQDNTIKISNVSLGGNQIVYKPFLNYNYPITASAISNDDKFIAVGNSESGLRILEAKSGKIFINISGLESGVQSLFVNREQKYFGINCDGGTMLYNLSTFKVDNIIKKNWELQNSTDSKYIVGRGECKSDNADPSKKYKPCYNVWNSDLTELNFQLPLRDTINWNWSTFKLAGKYLAAGSYNSVIDLWDLETRKLLFSITASNNDSCKHCRIKEIEMNLAQNILAANFYSETDYKDNMIIIDIQSGKNIITLKPLDDNGQFTSFEFSSDGAILATTGNGLSLWNTSNWDIINTDDTNKMDNINFSPNGNFIAGTAPTEKEKLNKNSIEIYDVKLSKVVCKLEGHPAQISKVEFLNDSLILSGGHDSKVKLWDVFKCEMIMEFVDCKNNNYVALTKDNYYSFSKGAFSNVNFKIDGKLYPFEQFDLQFNRPDILMNSVGLSDTILINSYKNAHDRRLRKMGFSDSFRSTSIKLPETVITNADSLPFLSPNREIIINIKFSGNGYRMKRYNIWVNDVSIFGTRGINVSGLNIDSLEITKSIYLSNGVNKIQVSCFNESLLESLKDQVFVNYMDDKVNTALYVFGLGVTKYRDSQKNLLYPTKDGRDIIFLLDSINKINNYWSNIYVDTLFDENVLLGNIQNAKSHLIKSKVDDIVLIYYSGHGLLDKKLDYYLASYDTDFSNPNINGISIDTLEWLLDSIPARNKILIIDACHSGEIDKELKRLFIKKDTINEMLSFKGDPKIESSEYDKSYYQGSLELMKNLFTDLDKRTGSIIISASGGYQAALESHEWGNSSLAYCFKNGLVNLLADSNKDGTITINELKNYIEEAVEKLTNGKQRPNTRKENISNDFVIWSNTKE